MQYVQTQNGFIFWLFRSHLISKCTSSKLKHDMHKRCTLVKWYRWALVRAPYSHLYIYIYLYTLYPYHSDIMLERKHYHSAICPAFHTVNSTLVICTLVLRREVWREPGNATYDFSLWILGRLLLVVGHLHISYLIVYNHKFFVIVHVL